MDVIYNFFENKLSPAVAVLKDILEGRDFQGNKPTPLNELINLTVPIIVTNYTELAKDPKSANIVIAMIADALGISTNTYGLEPKQQLKKDLTDKKRAGGNIEKELQKGYEEGTLNRNDILQIKREARLSQEIIDFKYLDFDKGMEAYFDLEEKYKTQAMGILQGKYLRKYKNASIPEKKELREKWTEFLAKKRGK